MYIDQDIIDSPHCTYSYPQYQLVNSRLPLHLQYHYFSKWHRKNHHQFQPRILKDESFFLKMKNNFENKFWKITSSSSLKISSSSLNVGPSSHNLCLTSCCCSGSEKNIFFEKSLLNIFFVFYVLLIESDQLPYFLTKPLRINMDSV